MQRLKLFSGREIVRHTSIIVVYCFPLLRSINILIDYKMKEIVATIQFLYTSQPFIGRKIALIIKFSATAAVYINARACQQRPRICSTSPPLA